MAKMKAMVVEQPGKGFTLREMDIPDPRAHEVRVRVQACGVCHSDSLLVNGEMPGLSYPRIPGHEVVGVIDSIGPDVAGWKVGARVGVGWSPGYCGYCGRCRHGEMFACENVHGATGITRDGGYATHMIADATALARMPDELGSVDSAPLLCAGITTFNALRHSGANAGELVAILGVGGLGHLAVQYAAKQGFKVVGVNRGKDKEELARSLGAHAYIDSATTDPAKALQAMGGAKVILATVTSAEAMQSIVDGLGINGTMMMIGAVTELKVSPLSLLMKNAKLQGWYSGTSIDSEDTLKFSALNNVRSMNELFSLEQAPAAFERMMTGNARFRAVLKIA